MVESRRAFSPILLAKLKQPDVATSFVVRPRLLKLLNSGLENKFTLVVAPAGFGKTALIASWIESLAQDEATAVPAAWLSLDAEDSDLGTFLRYVIAALRRIPMPALRR